MRALILGLAVLFSATRAGAEPKMTFWRWFESNDERIASYESNQEAIFDEIADQLSKIHEDLTFEIGPLIDGRRDFVVSAGGIKSAFPAVESLAASAPKLSRWNVIAFRPRHEPILAIGYGAVRVDPKDVRYWLGRHDGEIAVVIYLPKFASYNETTKKMIAYLFLDQSLGEYDVEMGLGPIDVRAVENVDPSQVKPIDQLAKDFDEMRSQSRRITSK
ncbi:MAG: hypothetical protein R3F21_10335 [Myxococcota bacterium]